MNTRPLHLHYPPEADPDTAPAPAFSTAPAPQPASPDAPVPPLNLSMPSWYLGMRWILTKGLLLGLLLCSLGLAVYAVFIDRDRSTANDAPATSSTVGSIGAHPSDASWTANAGDQSKALASAATLPPPVSSDASNAPAAAPAAPEAPAAALAIHPGDVAGNLQAARGYLHAANLADAKVALDDVLATQPDNPEARALQQDLIHRQQRRDASLQVAVACAKDQLWSCVRNNAADALAADSSSRITQALLEQSIRASGWASPASHAAPPAVAKAAAPLAQAAPHAGADAGNSAGTSAGSGAGNSDIDLAEHAIEASGWRNPPLPPNANALLNGAAKSQQ